MLIFKPIDNLRNPTCTRNFWISHRFLSKNGHKADWPKPLPHFWKKLVNWGYKYSQRFELPEESLWSKLTCETNRCSGFPEIVLSMCKRRSLAQSHNSLLHPCPYGNYWIEFKQCTDLALAAVAVSWNGAYRATRADRASCSDMVEQSRPAAPLMLRVHRGECVCEFLWQRIAASAQEGANDVAVCRVAVLRRGTFARLPSACLFTWLPDRPRGRCS